MRIPDIAPTLSDTQMLDFCRQGFLVLESVVADEINERVCEFIGRQPYAGGNGGAFEDEGLLEQAWFVEHVLLNPQAAGAVRSLLGKNASLPTWMYNHQARCPKAAQTWHRDGCSRYGHQVNHLQVFYYPQDTPLELGPYHQPPTGILLSPGHAPRTRPHRSAARLAFSLQPGALDGALRHD